MSYYLGVKKLFYKYLETSVQKFSDPLIFHTFIFVFSKMYAIDKFVCDYEVKRRMINGLLNI